MTSKIGSLMPNYRVQSLDSLDDLRLDPYNPRLRQDEEGADESLLISIMLARFKIEEVAESIIGGGGLDQDPLIAVTEDEETRVVEGNRRLTAVKLLRNPQLAPPSRRQKWIGLSRSMTPVVANSIKSLSVRVYPDRDDTEVSAYIGFRHVTGVLPWPALEKASYIARLAARGESYAALAEKLGSYPSHMARHHLAYQLVQQAEDWGLDGRSQMSNAFGVLLRALQTEGVKQYLGVEQSNEPSGNTAPVPAAGKPKFAEFVKWTFGTEEHKRVLPESRDLTKWSKILQSEAAVRYLQNADEPKFDRAWAKSGGESETVAESLWKASYLLSDVIPLIGEHLNNNSVKDAAREVRRYERQINRLMTMADGDSSD
jgi:hypothetical protein